MASIKNGVLSKHLSHIRYSHGTNEIQSRAHCKMNRKETNEKKATRKRKKKRRRRRKKKIRQTCTLILDGWNIGWTAIIYDCTNTNAIIGHRWEADEICVGKNERVCNVPSMMSWLFSLRLTLNSNFIVFSFCSSCSSLLRGILF